MLLLSFLWFIPLSWAASPKRGVCAQNLSAEDFRALSPGVSWWYNWYFEPDAKDFPPSMPFVPMFWSHAPELWTGIQARLAGEKGDRMVFALNEPNLRGQAFMTPEETALAFLGLKKLADARGIKVVGPHMALGSAPDESIKAWDPLSKKEEVYTFMIPFLEAFKYFLKGHEMPDLGLHVYGNSGEMRWAVGELAKRYGVKIWVTEFNEWKAPDMEAQIAYMKDTVAFLEQSDDVAAYAWFMSRLDDESKCLLGSKPGELTALGQAYLKAPF